MRGAMPGVALSGYGRERGGVAATRRGSAPFSWAIGGYEWQRHLHFQHSVQQRRNRYHDDQARARIPSKNHRNPNRLVDHQKQPSDSYLLHHQKLSSAQFFSMPDHTKNHPQISSLDQCTRVKLSDVISVVDHQSNGSIMCVSEHRLTKDCRAAKGKSEGVRSSSKGWRWAAALWRWRLVRMVMAKAKKIRPLRCSSHDDDALNYDASSYQKNFEERKTYSNPSFEASDGVSLTRSRSLPLEGSHMGCDRMQRQRSASVAVPHNLPREGSHMGCDRMQRQRSASVAVPNRL